MASPRLPWEVIERVIGHSGDNPWQPLHNFSLTCRDLRPRALCLLVADVRFKKRNKIFDFCDFLKANPHLKPLVRSVDVEPAHFAPVPLLSILPNLSTLKFTYPKPGPIYRTTDTLLNQTILTCCRHLGTHIRTLHLSNLSFRTHLDFARVLLTFPHLTGLGCLRVVALIGAKGNNEEHLILFKERLFQRLHLLTMDIDLFHLDFVRRLEDEVSMAGLLLDSGLVQSTVETLTIHVPIPYYQLSRTFDWPRLRSLVLKLRFTTEYIADATVFLKDLSPSTLQDVVVEFDKENQVTEVAHTFSDKPIPGRFEELDQTLLRFSRPRIVCPVVQLRDGRHSFWAQEIGKHFPVLQQRGAFAVTLEKVNPGTGHDSCVLDLATSPDGKWVATSSRDFTIILWNTTNGAIARQWVAHNYQNVYSLAFSPDSRCLVSGGRDSEVKIWDLNEGSCELVTTLKGHTGRVVKCCAWSSRGDIIASGSDDGTVRLWDAHTFRELHILQEHPPDRDAAFIIIVAFSPDGHWLVSMSSRSYQCHIWNVDSATLHKSFLADDRGHFQEQLKVAAFDPGSTRLLVQERNVVKLVDIETADELAVLGGMRNTADAAFSPDGTLIVTGSASHDGMVKLWNANTGVELASLEGHGKRVRNVCFSPCGKYVASASGDGTVRLWRTQDGSCVAIFSEHNTMSVDVVAFSQDGKTLWSGDSRGTIIMRRMRDIIPTDEPNP